MKVRIPTARKNGRSGEIYGASARRPCPLVLTLRSFLRQRFGTSAVAPFPWSTCRCSASSS